MTRRRLTLLAGFVVMSVYASACRRQATGNVAPDPQGSMASSEVAVPVGADASSSSPTPAILSPSPCSDAPGACPDTGRVCLYASEDYAPGLPQRPDTDCWSEGECGPEGYVLRSPLPGPSKEVFAKTAIACAWVNCPTSAKALPGATCSAAGASCWYDDLRCRCVKGAWSCGRVACPPDRPTVGTSCEDEWRRCRYGERCGGGPSSEEFRVCRHGTWEEGRRPCFAWGD